MIKQYRLLKETYLLKEGAIFEEKCDDGDQDFVCRNGEFHKFGNDGYETFATRETVLKQPEWFEEVKSLYFSFDAIKIVEGLIKKAKLKIRI